MGTATSSADRAPDLVDRIAMSWRAYIVIGLLALLAGLPGLFSVPPLDRDESRFAQATAQMLETGDFVRINVQDEPRNKKPVGIHWLQAATVAATTGVEAREIWAYRLPSLLGAALTALATFWGGAALIGRRAAFVGSALLAVSLLISTEAMIAKTDSMMVAMTTMALAAIAHLRAGQARRPGRMALLAWACVGAGILLKGPITPMVVGLTLLAIALWERRVDWMRPLAHWSGPLIAGVITLPWLIAIGIETNGQFFSEAITGDLAPKVSAGGEHPATPPGLHSLLAPLLLFPASLGLAPAAVLGFKALRAPRAGVQYASERYLLAWVLPSFLVFEAATTKLAHYPMPTYPAIALLCGLGLTNWWSQGRIALRLAMVPLYLIGALGIIGAAALLATYAPGAAEAGERRALQAALILGAAVLLASAVIVWSKRLSIALGSVLAVALFGLWAVRERGLPEARGLLVSDAADRALIREGLHPLRSPKPPATIFVVGYRETSLVFETGTATRLALGPEAGESVNVGDAALVEGRQAKAFESALAERGLIFQQRGQPVVGHNYSNDDQVSLQPGIVAALSPATP